MQKYDMKIITLALVVFLVFVILNWRRRYYDYQCGKCKEKFNLPVWKAVLSVHIMGTKYIKCPKCGKWSLAKPIPKE